MFRHLSVGFFIGWFAFVSEFLLFRESFVLFGGNDISVGSLYFLWFFFSALGANVASKAVSPMRAKRSIDKWIWEFAFAFLFSLVCFLFFASSLNFRLGIEPGFLKLFLFQAIAISPTAFMIGRLFGLASLIESPSGILLRETIAFAVSSFLVTSMFAMGLPPTLIICFAMSVFSLWFFRRKYFLLGVMALLVFPGVFMIGYPYAKRSIYSRYGVKETASKDSPYGRLQIFDKFGQKDVFYTGRFVGQLNAPYLVAPLAVLPAVQARRDGSSALVIGDFARGLACELKRSGIDKVYVLELDGNILSLERETYKCGDITYKQGDVADILTERLSFDAIILAVNMDTSFSVIRFFSREYFQRYKSLLKQGGVFAFSFPGSQDLLTKPQLMMSACVLKTLKPLFKYVYYVPSDPAFILCSDGKIVLSPGFIKAKMKERGYSSPFFEFGKINDLLDTARGGLFLGRIMSFAPKVKENKFGSAPLYFYSLAGDVYRQFGYAAWQALVWIRNHMFFAFAIIFVVFYSALLRNKRVLVSIVSFLHISVYMAMLLGYQFSFGVIFLEIGLLAAIYMAFAGMGIFSSKRFGWYAYAFPYFVIAMPILSLFIAYVRIKPLYWIFISLNAFCHGLFLGTKMREVSGSGYVYWYDLIGAATSSLLFAVGLVIPFGIIPSSSFLIALVLPLLFFRNA